LVTVGFITCSLATALVVGSAAVSADNPGHDAEAFGDTQLYTLPKAGVALQGANAPVGLVLQGPFTNDDRN
jgi:hypothetical protein